MNNQNNSYQKFLIIWIGELISSIGSGLTAFGLSVYVFGQTGSATSVALTTLCAFLPTVLLAPVAGMLADRFDRRLLMIIGDFFSALALIFILICLWDGRVLLSQIYAGVAVSSAFAALLDPAYKATVTDLLDETQFTKAGGMVQLAGSAKFLLAPVIAGLLMTRFDIRLLLMIDICTFFVTVTAILAVRQGMPAKKTVSQKHSIQEELREGWNAVYQQKGVFMLTLLLTGITFSMGFLQTLLKPMLLPTMSAGAEGMVETLSAIGMLFSSLFLGVYQKPLPHVKVLAAALCFSGLFLGLLGSTPTLWLIVLFGFFFFASLPFCNTCADVLIRKNIPNEVQGRAWGFISVVSQTGYLAAYALAGPLADNVFCPLLETGGPLAPNLGRILGVGPGRGIGLLLLLLGLLTAVLALCIPHVNAIRSLEPIAGKE